MSHYPYIHIEFTDCMIHITPVCVTSLFFVLLLVINCAALDHPKNGFVSSSSTVEGGTATYSCKLGWKGKIHALVLVLETGVALNQPAEVRLVYMQLIDLVVTV